MTLRELEIGHHGLIKSVGGEGVLRQHFLDMGIVPGAQVSVVKLAPMGDPMELRIHGYELTLRLDDAAQIEIEPITDEQFQKNQANAQNEAHKHIKKSKREHPGYGQGGIYHSRKDENPLPDETLLTFALVGNQNCGKTTLFNQLTGSNQHVGNFPGVTVDRKDGMIKNHENTQVTDLPGIYSMSPYTSEEIVSRNFVLNDKPKAIINIIDATNIERNLYLTMQLLELNIPLVVALNMMDEVRGNGGTIDVNCMEEMLGVPIIPISAAKNQGIEELVEHALHVAHYQEKPQRQDFCDENDHDGAVHRCLHAIIHLIEDHARRADIPVRFAASKLVEGDALILDMLNLDDNEKEMLEHIILQMEKERGMDRCAAMADMRFSYIMKVTRETVVKPHESREHIRTAKLDRILTGKYTAIPCFVLLMIFMFLFTFQFAGAFLQGLFEKVIDNVTMMVDAALTFAKVNDTLHSLIIDGIFIGVGSVLVFLPIIVMMFLFLSILEDSGYIARVAFFMDRPLRKIGLSGRSIVPLLIGFGCSVPAVMSTRTMPSERDRKMTILLVPFMSCTAKLPVYAFLVNAFFKEKSGLIIAALYFGGVILGIINALLYKKLVFKGEAVPFVMELPNYRLPSLKNVSQLLWEKSKDFLHKAFSIIFIASIVVWFLQHFNTSLNLVADSSESMMAGLSGVLVPLFAPIGLGDWRIITSLISGFMAKESLVATMDILYGGSVATVLSGASAAALLVFSLLYTPCIATIATIRKELGHRGAIFIVLWQCALAWLAAWVTYVLL